MQVEKSPTRAMPESAKPAASAMIGDLSKIVEEHILVANLYLLLGKDRRTCLCSFNGALDRVFKKFNSGRCVRLRRFHNK